MSGGKKKTTICFEPEMLEYLRSRAAEDIADFDARIGEPNIGYDEFVLSLKADGIT
jgi:hypothetical protein